MTHNVDSDRPPLPTVEGWHRDPDGLTYYINERRAIEPGTRHYPTDTRPIPPGEDQP